MPVTSTDITNRALQLLGTRTTVTSLAEASNEAIQASLCYEAIRDWCLGLENWSFARKTAVLTTIKSVSSVVPPWNATSEPSPPWLHEYQYPADALLVRYVSNAVANADGTAFLGEPQRFAVAVDIVAAVPATVILTNTTNAIAIYTVRVTDPTNWPWYFERFVVNAMASTLSMALTGNIELLKFLDGKAMQQLQIAIQADNVEGLRVDDTTPEWIQALGINYPYRRDDGKSRTQQPQQGQQNGDRR